MLDWRTLSPNEVLERWNCLDLEKTAYVLDLHHRKGAIKGRPDPAQVLKLIRAGKLHIVDPDQTRHYWTISATEIRRYRDAGQEQTVAAEFYGRRPRVVSS
jgi:hypothetical protein